MPTPKQMDKLAADAARRAAVPAEPAPGPGDPLPEAYWDALLRDPRGRTNGEPIQSRRLSEIPRHLLRVWCRRLRPHRRDTDRRCRPAARPARRLAGRRLLAGVRGTLTGRLMPVPHRVLDTRGQQLRAVQISLQ